MDNKPFIVVIMEKTFDDLKVNGYELDKKNKNLINALKNRHNAFIEVGKIEDDKVIEVDDTIKSIHMLGKPITTLDLKDYSLFSKDNYSFIYILHK